MSRLRRHLLISCALLAPIALAAFAPRLRAHETDQFTTPPSREFADLGDPLSLWFYQILDKAVARANQDIEARIKELGPEVDLSEFHTQEYIAPIVNGQIPWAMDVIEGWEREIHSKAVRDQYPGRVVAFKEPFKNIMQHTHFFLDPRQLWRLFLSSTMKAHGVYFGTDKIGHFTDMGMNYWREYSKVIREGKTEDEAVRRAIRLGSHGLILSERGMLGYMTAGAYSNADMASNYLGLCFYRNLTEPVILKGETRPPMLVLDGPYWRLAPHVTKESNFFSWFVSDHWDEALNPSHYEAGMREKIREAVRKRRSVILERYLDEHGNRRPGEWFDAKGNELRTYWGAEYGHVGQYDEFVTLGNTCVAKPAKDGAVAPLSLHFAASRGQSEQVRTLLSSGGDVNAFERTAEPFSSDWGNRPLHWAARDGNAETIATLVEAGADVKATNDRGVTPLHRAVRHPKIAELLLEKGARTDAADLRGHRPIHWAARDASEDSADTVATLLKRGASANDRDREGRTPLHLAAKAGNTNTVKALLAAGADVNAKDHFGVTPLHVAAAEGEADVVEALVAGGAIVTALDDFGCTPLHDAARGGSDAVATILLRAGADPHVADAHGTRAIEIARRHHHDAVARLLQRVLPTQTVANELLRSQD